MPPVAALMRAEPCAETARRASFTAAVTMSCSISVSSGVDGRRVDDDGLNGHVALSNDLHHAAASGCLSGHVLDLLPALSQARPAFSALGASLPSCPWQISFSMCRSGTHFSSLYRSAQHAATESLSYRRGQTHRSPAMTNNKSNYSSCTLSNETPNEPNMSATSISLPCERPLAENVCSSGF